MALCPVAYLQAVRVKPGELFHLDGKDALGRTLTKT